MKQQQKLLAALLCAASPLVHADDTTLSEIVVTASRFETAPDSAPVNVTVISADDIRNSTAKTVPELLAQHAGIQTRSLDGTPNVMVDLRGFGMTGNENTLVLLDGQPLNNLDLSSIRWSLIPLDSIERIEIVNGGGAVLYGGGASGGTINIITRKTAKPFEAMIRGGAGSYGALDFSAALGAHGESTSMHISANSQRSDNYRDNNKFEQNSMEGDVRTDVGRGDVALKFGADNQKLRLPGARQVNPATGLNQPASDPRGTSTPLDYANQDGGHISLGTQQKLDFGEFAAEVNYRDNTQKAFYYDYFSPGIFNNYLDTRLKLLSFTPRLKITRPLGDMANELVIGADLADWDYDSLRATDPDTLSTPAAHIKAKQRNRALYAQDMLQLTDATRLTLGARVQRASYDANDEVNPANYASGNHSYNLNAWEIGLRHAITSSWSAYGRTGRSFRVATVDEIYDQFGGPLFDSQINMLQPQTSQDSEIGLDYTGGGSKLRAALYYMNLDNEIHYNALTSTNMNLPPTRRYGLELEGSHIFTNGFETHAAYTYTVAKFREGVYTGFDDTFTIPVSVNISGNDIPQVPRQRLSLSAIWPLAEKTRLSASALYVGKQHFDNDQSNTFGQLMPSYTTVDLKLSQQVDAWTLAASVNNLFDEKYSTYGVASAAIPSTGRYNVYPMPERNFFLSAQYRY
jgi:iron complex outermembrane receptor protein